MNEKAKILMEKYGFDEWTALEYVEAGGKCVYCGINLLENLNSFAAADIDHILPKSKYPEVEAVKNNRVLSCRSCNSTKGKMDLGELPWSVVDAVENHRFELIEMVKCNLLQKRLSKSQELDEIRKVIEGK
jgi:5-methylcytosine-specific restriction endonuclease McrA